MRSALCAMRAFDTVTRNPNKSLLSLLCFLSLLGLTQVTQVIYPAWPVAIAHGVKWGAYFTGTQSTQSTQATQATQVTQVTQSTRITLTLNTYHVRRIDLDSTL